MAVLRGTPHNVRGDALGKRLVFDTVRGVLRVRKWPRKRGPPRSAKQAFWVDWFKQANRLAKYADGMSQARAIAMTKGSGMYPRDVLLKAMAGRLYAWADTTGWRWFSVAAIGDVSNSLDVLGQTVGDIMVRAIDRWRTPPAGSLGDLLTNQGAGAPPIWQAPTGGLIQEELSNSPIVADNTVNAYVLDVSAYLSVSVRLLDLDLASADTIKMQLSTDGGSSYKAGATDYRTFYLNTVTEANANGTRFDVSDGSAANDHQATMVLDDLRSPMMSWRGMVGVLTSSVAQRAGFTTFAGPVTHVKLYTGGGANFKLGTIRAIGSRGT